MLRRREDLECLSLLPAWRRIRLRAGRVCSCSCLLGAWRGADSHLGLGGEELDLESDNDILRLHGMSSHRLKRNFNETGLQAAVCVWGSQGCTASVILQPSLPPY